MRFSSSSRWFGLVAALTLATRAEAQTYQQPAPGYTQPAPGYTQPAPGYQQQPAPGYQQQPAPGYQQQPAPGYQQQPAPPQSTIGYQQSWSLQNPTRTSSSGRSRDSSEMAPLYATSVAYGAGMGVWFSSELGLKDPGTFLIAPLVLGVAAPIGAWALDRPKMKRGQPSAMTAGMLLGAGEGIGIWSTQAVRANSEKAWGFRGLSRSVGIGSTLGLAAGWAVGEFLQPPPMTSWLAVSGAFWGTAVGSMFTYGATSGNSEWGKSNDKTSIGGLIGYNVGLLAAGGLGVLTVPSANQVAWMWAGAGIGAAASLPVFLFYVDDGGPPARRGFVFMGTATTLGIIAGGLFSSGSAGIGKKHRDFELASRRVRSIGHIEGVLPAISSNQVGVSLWGTLE